MACVPKARPSVKGGACRLSLSGRTRPVHATARATRDATDWIPIVPRPRDVSLD